MVFPFAFPQSNLPIPARPGMTSIDGGAVTPLEMIRQLYQPNMSPMPQMSTPPFRPPVPGERPLPRGTIPAEPSIAPGAGIPHMTIRPLPEPTPDPEPGRTAERKEMSALDKLIGELTSGGASKEERTNEFLSNAFFNMAASSNPNWLSALAEGLASSSKQTTASRERDEDRRLKGAGLQLDMEQARERAQLQREEMEAQRQYRLEDIALKKQQMAQSASEARMRNQDDRWYKEQMLKLNQEELALKKETANRIDPAERMMATETIKTMREELKGVNELMSGLDPKDPEYGPLAAQKEALQNQLRGISAGYGVKGISAPSASSQSFPPAGSRLINFNDWHNQRNGS